MSSAPDRRTDPAQLRSDVLHTSTTTAPNRPPINRRAARRAPPLLGRPAGLHLSTLGCDPPVVCSSAPPPGKLVRRAGISAIVPPVLTPDPQPTRGFVAMPPARPGAVAVSVGTSL